MCRQTESGKDSAKEKTVSRLNELLSLQKQVEENFGEKDYNVFVFGSYLTTGYVEGLSDIDIAIYAEDFGLYKRLSLYLEEYFKMKGIRSDIFYIDTTMRAPIYCAPLESQVQFTDYYPEKLVAFRSECRKELEELKAKVAGNAGINTAVGEIWQNFAEVRQKSGIY